MKNLIQDALKEEMKDLKEEMKEWRRLLHQHPQTSYEETFACEFVQKKLQEFGIPVHAGLAKTGVVGVLKGKPGRKKIALRADIDALNIFEENDFAYQSKFLGKMHACGHDGHTTMLLGAAKLLSQTKNFYGEVYFIFQPAEEGGAGAEKMMKEGLFEKFPADTIWGLHNSPGLPLGHVAVKVGSMMASADEFEIKIHGKGSHAAMPHFSNDPILIAAHLITALQSIVARNLSPTESGVVSVTMMHAGSALNIIPEQVSVKGTFRTLEKSVRTNIMEKIKKISSGICEAFGAKCEVIFFPNNYPVLVNSKKETDFAIAVAEKCFGANAVNGDAEPTLGGEDFAFMLQKKPGSYIFLGNGAKGEKGSNPLHTPKYDFNDDAAPFGVQYWVELTQAQLAENEI